jgi:tellurite resistance protein TerC
MKRLMDMTYKAARRIIIAVVGAAVLLTGIVMLVTPGPAFIVIPAGLAILGPEFAWARHWLKKARETISAQGARVRGRRVERRRGEP